MLKSLFLISLALAIAIGAGAGSVWLMMEEVEDFGAFAVGQWTVNPLEGTPEADPYAKARFAREGKLALGVAEGVQFVTTRDTDGRLLRGSCDYIVSGSLPTARFWTLYAVEADASAPPQRALQSLALLRQSGGSFAISLSRYPAPGNWLRIETAGPYRLILAIYDTPTVSSADLAGIALPGVVRERCHG